jgi:hypothetical protein
LRWTTDTSWFPEPPIEKRVKVPLTNGTVLFVADCTKVHANDDLLDQAARQMSAQEDKPLDFKRALPPGTISDDCVVFLDKFFAPLRGQMTAVPLGNPNQVAIESQYWPTYLHTRNQVFEGDLLFVVIFGLIGFPTGLILWGFYRLVRFAVKG